MWQDMLRTLLLIVLAAAVDSAAVELAVNQRSSLSALTDKLPFTLSADIVPATSTGGVMGFCAGRAARVAGDATSIAAGAAFIFLSALQKGVARRGCECCQMGVNAVGWDGTGRDGMGWDEMGWEGVHGALPMFVLLAAGYITINYEKFERDVRSLLDVNKDGKASHDVHVHAVPRLERSTASQDPN
jgi:uncharacterized membrane protein (Fun14 family)